MQIVDDEHATSDQFSMSVVAGKPMNTLAPFVSRSQLIQGQSRTLLSSHIFQLSEKHIVCVALSVITGWRQRPLTICDLSQRNYFTPTEHHIVSEVYTRDYRNNCAPSIVP
jgi:hypothetical protein